MLLMFEEVEEAEELMRGNDDDDDEIRLINSACVSNKESSLEKAASNTCETPIDFRNEVSLADAIEGEVLKYAAIDALACGEMVTTTNCCPEPSLSMKSSVL